MKTFFKYMLAVAAAGATAAGAIAQTTNSGYFLENYNYRYQMNPALGNSDNFVSMPALGDLNIAMRGNLHLSSVLFNRNGRTVLFTNPNVSVEEALKGIHDRNRLGANIKLNILSAGFKAWGGYNTVSINAAANINATLPGAFFSLAKEGISNKTYDITDLRASAMGYGEFALGHSRDITQVPGLRVGATVKFLVGVANVDAYFNNAHLVLGEDSWTATTNADIYANVGGFQFDHEINDNTGREYVSGANLDGDGSIGPNGFGVAFDLGATYKWSDFTFSLAATDLGFINFSDTHYATTNGDQTINTDSYIFSANGDASNSFENEWDKLKGDLDKLYQMQDHGNIGSRSRNLAATLNVGVEYEFPLYRKLHFGVLSSTRFAGKYTWTEARISANVNPVKCFSADVNVAFGTYGVGFGWLLNLHTKGFNLFLGMDHTLGEVSKQFVPLNSNASVNFGINFPF
ncbi:MAG: DUF5723 family protein [Odoribacter sp.]|nr:DUF5723 family protein [Odoribacter sp.]